MFFMKLAWHELQAVRRDERFEFVDALAAARVESELRSRSGSVIKFREINYTSGDANVSIAGSRSGGLLDAFNAGESHVLEGTRGNASTCRPQGCTIRDWRLDRPTSRSRKC